jgi:hypothetical protein
MLVVLMVGLSEPKRSMEPVVAHRFRLRKRCSPAAFNWGVPSCRALGEFGIVAIQTTIPLHQRIVDNAEFQRGKYMVDWLEGFVAR